MTEKRKKLAKFKTITDHTGNCYECRCRFTLNNVNCILWNISLIYGKQNFPT